MSETKKSRPLPYVEQRPGNQILASDWNELQVQAREEISAARAELDALRRELAEIRGLREALAEQVAALGEEVKTTQLRVDGSATITSDVEVQGTVRAGGGRFGELALGRAAHGEVEFPFETIQLRPENNLRICFGGDERYFLGHSGELVAPTLRVRSLCIGEFRLDEADRRLRISGPGEPVVAHFSADRGVRVHPDGTTEILFAQGRWVFQTDGNLVKYDTSNRARYSSGQGW